MTEHDEATKLGLHHRALDADRAAFARDIVHLDTLITGLLRAAEGSSLGLAMLRDLKDWCQASEQRIRIARVHLEQATELRRQQPTAKQSTEDPQ